jgi:hypothetical protein
MEFFPIHDQPAAGELEKMSLIFIEVPKDESND